MTTNESALRISRDTPLAPLTTIGIGGAARFFVTAREKNTLIEALGWAQERGHDVLILGGGSNLLVSDEGFDGLVIHLDLRGVELSPENGTTLIDSAAGEDWDALVATAVERGLAGIECLSGIPGRVGATPIQNVGAYGQEVSETVVEVEALDRHTGSVVTIPNEKCEFGYRDSRFKSREKDRYVILSVRYRLRDGGAPTIRYSDLETHLAEEGITSPTLADVRRTVLNIRSGKGMVIDENDPDSRSAGSFFTNPVIPEEELDGFLRRVKGAGVLEDGESVPRFPAGENLVKLSAAWIIQHAGFHRGLVHGNVGLSSKHTLAIVNRGGGTAAEVLELVEMIRQRVQRLFGIELVPEPNFVGFE
ncbi:MAG: UDP-N-acetylmuramate dehydrogenase [Thermoanaerobaculia bacterium]|nr:UDP-N-acetylmuramate dehydrogenase [Thermoanaerobaculia bacterium]